MNKKIFLILCVLISMAFGSYFSSDFTRLILEKLERYATSDYPEKVYVQTDKSVYSIGEDIWFTGYLVNGVNHTKSEKSNVLYVELINEKDSIVDYKKLFVEAVNEAGNFEISEHWQPGNYQLRAYTNYMRNQDASYFFKKDIWISDAKAVISVDREEEALNAQKEIQRPSLKFYPEGGELVAGVNNKVALKLQSKEFDTKDLTGIIYDNEGTKVTTFKVYEFGLGLFNMIPEVGKSYYASITIAGSEDHYPLPKIKSEGIALAVVHNGDNIVVHLQASKKKRLKGTFLVAHQRGQQLFEKFEEQDVNEYTIVLNSEKFSDGVVHLTLFNADGNPLAERLFYIENHKNSVDVSIDRSKAVLSTRDKITLKLNAVDSEGKNVGGNFSMTVKDKSVTPDNLKEETIKSWLLLNSDLRGEIENPTYFFEKGDKRKKEFLLDLVMLTNGWRRFTWPDLLKSSKELEFDIEKGIFISGTTKNLKSPFEPLSTKTRMTFVDKPHYQEVQQSDSLGNFKFGPFVFYDTMSTLLEARKTNFNSDKNRDRKVLITVDINESFPEVISEEKNNSDKLNTEALLRVNNYVAQMKVEYGEDVNDLEEVVVIASKMSYKQQREDEMDARTMYGSPTDRVVTEDVHGAEWKTVLDILRSKPGVRVDGNSVSLRGGGGPAFYLDGMEIDSTYIQNIAGSEIEFIDILKGPDANIFANSGNGVIALYSKMGIHVDPSKIKRSPGIIDFPSIGYYTAKEFYAPDHINGFKEQTLRDFRTTIHWEPEIRLNPDDDFQVSFFTSDAKGTYLIEIEGLTDDGRPVFSKSSFIVE